MSIFIISILGAIVASLKNNEVKGQQYFNNFVFIPAFIIVYLLPSYYYIIRDDYLLAFLFLVFYSLFIVALPCGIIAWALEWILIEPSIKIIKKKIESNTLKSSNHKVSHWLKSTKAKNIFVALLLISIFGGCLYFISRENEQKERIEEFLIEESKGRVEEIKKPIY